MKKIIKKIAVIACQFTEKQYLCRPIIIKEAYKGLTICVLIAFFIGLKRWLVNRRCTKTGW